MAADDGPGATEPVDESTSDPEVGAAQQDPEAKGFEEPAESPESEERENGALAPEDGLQAERDEYLDHLRRVQADFENYRKRVLREQGAHLERATEGLIERLLPVLDAFELAIASGEADVARLRKGIELVSAQLLGILEREGLERIEARGKPFDPSEHEAIVLVEGEGEPTVDEVMRPGYRLKGRVLRPAMVKVTR
ncbi:MAG: nucleotide exchange factor GrpE [Acidimicrobiia bacterium]